jgi:hypothetical protein
MNESRKYRCYLVEVIALDNNVLGQIISTAM